MMAARSRACDFSFCSSAKCYAWNRSQSQYCGTIHSHFIQLRSFNYPKHFFIIIG